MNSLSIGALQRPANFFVARARRASLLFCGFTSLMALAPAQAAPVAARNSDDFVASLGVNTHYEIMDTATSQGNFDNGVRGDLQNLGIRFVRVNATVGASQRAELVRRAQVLGNLGIKSNLIFESRKSLGVLNSDTHTPAEAVQLIKDIGPAFCVAEGPNEPEHSNDYWRFSYNGHDWPSTQGLKDYTRDLYNAIKADPATQNVPVLPASVLGTDIGNQSAYLDFGNLHTYPSGLAPLTFFAENLDKANDVSGTKPVMATETGYHTAIPTTHGQESGDKPVTELVQAKYLLRTYFLFWNRGIARTFLYQLRDDIEATGVNHVQANWGLVRSNGTPKPSYYAIKDTISLLKDANFNATSKTWVPNAVSPRSLDYSLSGDLTGIEQVLLQNSGGKFFLVLFNNAQSQRVFDQNGQQIWDASGVENVPSRALTLNLATPIASARAFSPVTNATNATNLTISGNAISLSVPDHPLIVELTPGTAPAPLANGLYKLIARHSGKALTIETGASTLQNGAKAVQWQNLSDGGDHFKWQVTSLGNGYHTLVAKHSNKALDVSGISLENGALIHQWSYGGANNQQWQIESVGDGFYKLLARHSGKALDVSGISSDDGAPIHQWTYVGGHNQQWRFEPTTSSSTGNGTGLKGDYFSGSNFGTLVKTQTDPTVNFDWGNGSPQNVGGGAMTSVGPDAFSVRWTGQVQAMESGTYTFTTTSDDGVRLWVNNQLLVDKWQSQAATAWSGSLVLSAGQKVSIKLEYFDGSGLASAQLRWTRPGQSLQIVPQTQLYPN